MHLCQISAVFDFIRRKPEIERYGDGTCLQNPEIDRQPFQAVEHEDRYSVTLLDPSGKKHIGNSISLFIKDAPCDFSSIRGRGCLLYQIVLLPGGLSVIFHHWVQLYESDFIAVKLMVSFK